ncbi:MAG: hypothetical protein HYY49_14065 [Ignavibacteriales bacterium]|nr:hypothetical protein [Ignavibacteriales bacterium]
MDQNKGDKSPTNNEEGQPNLLDYAVVLAKWRGFIVKSVLIVTVFSIIASLILPRWYKATVSILPPKDTGLLSSLGIMGAASSVGSALRNLPLGGRGSLGINLGAYNYLAILKSRTAMESVVRKFDLIKVYEVSDTSMEKAAKQLEDKVRVEIQNEDYITIDIWDEDPQRSADIANYFVEVLNQISNRLGTQEAKNNREFIEKRVAKSRVDLHKAEEDLKVYQEQRGILVSPDKENSSVAAIAELYALKAKKEIEIGILERTVSKNNPLLEQYRIELSEIDKKVAQIPQVGLNALRLYREVVIQQKIIEFLIPLYEQAKVDEQKDIPVILVLDKAVPAERKDKPKRMIIVLSAAFSSFLFSLGFVFMRERFLHFKEANPVQFETLRNAFRRQPVAK